MRQFVACKFRPTDKRTYEYHWDGDPLQRGDEVKVPHKSGDGFIRALVESVSEAPPAFSTKAILGKAEPIPVANLFPEVAHAHPSR